MFAIAEAMTLPMESVIVIIGIIVDTPAMPPELTVNVTGA